MIRFNNTDSIKRADPVTLSGKGRNLIMDEKKLKMGMCVKENDRPLQKGFSPRNLKKGAAVVVLVAVAAGAGKVTLKKMRFDRRQAEAAAKVELAQKLAVERNEPLLSSDEVLGKIASLLGTDEGSVTLKGLRLAEAKPDLREHKEHKDKEKGIMIASSSKRS